MTDYIIYFPLDSGLFRCINSKTKELTTEINLPRDTTKFTMLKYNDNTKCDEDLIAYSEYFKQWCDEIRYFPGIGFRYDQCYNDQTATIRFFNRTCLKNYKDHKPITYIEYKYMQKTPNYGIQYLQGRQNVYINGYSYDFKNFYGLVMNSKKLIPTKPGKEYILKKLPKILKHGFYHVSIQSTNNNFYKIFSFTKDNMYLHEDVERALKFKDVYDVSVNLICDGNPNAYLYEDEDLVELKSITDEWFRDLKKLKAKFPKNRLVKQLFSSVWGSLNAHNILQLSLDDITTNPKYMDKVGIDENDEYQILEFHEFEENTNKTSYYDILQKEKPYKHSIRLKSHITSYARSLIAEIALKDIDNLLRIHTDSVIFKNEMELNSKLIVPEEKTSGKLHFINNNCYKNLTNGYESKNYQRQINKK